MRRSFARFAAVPAALAGLALTILPASGASAASGPGRQSRVSNVAVAGGNVYLWSSHRARRSGDSCSLAFSVHSTKTGRDGALTAGHCVTTIAGGPAYTVHQTRDGKRNTTDPGHQLGTISSGDFRVGRNGDSAFVGLGAHRRALAEVFTGGAVTRTTIPVAGQARIHDGLHVCYSGAASGEHCGFTIVGRPRTVAFSDGGHVVRIRHEWRATRRTCTSRVGDSGAPVYVRSHGRAYAVGILSGGQQRTSQCPFFFTSVSLALTKLHLTLLRAPAAAS
jgi:hypothetical protein